MCKSLENDTSFSILHLVGVMIEEQYELTHLNLDLHITTLTIHSFRGENCQNAYHVGRKIGCNVRTKTLHRI